MAFLPEMVITDGSEKPFDTFYKMNAILAIHYSRNALPRIPSPTGKNGTREKKQNTLFPNLILPSSARMISKRPKPFSNAKPKR